MSTTTSYFFSHHTPIKPTPSPHQPLLTTKNILTTITLLPYNTPILPLRVHDHAPCQAKPRTASRLLLQKARVHRTWSERASAACSRLRFGSGEGGPCGRRSRSHNARLNGAVVDAQPSAWQAVKRSLVWLVASSLRQVKRSLCMACVGLVWRWRDASRRACALACVRWRSLRTSASCARRLHVRAYPCASNFLRIMRA